MIVLDSSVILKWVLPSETTDTVLAFRERHLSGENPVNVPDLFFYEAANVIALKSGLPGKRAEQALIEVCSIELEAHSPEMEDLGRAMKLAAKYKISAYDAAYVQLAKKLGATLVTADKKLHLKCADLGFVELLSA